jgi:4-cresol dehydrogenase (hydroxylating)
LDSAFGPSLDGLFLQSNFGIVTKLGIQITPAPEAYAYVEASVPNEDDLVPLIGTLSDLMRRSIILNSPSIGNIFRIALSSQAPEVHAKLNQYMKPNSCVPYSVLEEIRAQQGWGFWKSYFSLYGSVEMLPALIKTVDRAFAHIPGVQINYRQFHGSPGQAMKAPTEIEQEEIPHAGIPTMAPLGVIDTRGGRGGHVDYSPVIPPSGRELYEWYLTAKKRAVDARFDIFGDFHVFPRHVIGVELLVYAPGEEARVHDLYRILDQDGAEQGYIPYRTHVCHMERVAGKLDFNNDAFRRFTTLMKDTLDPNGILSPGKSGIWNSAVRQP